MPYDRLKSLVKQRTSHVFQTVTEAHDILTRDVGSVEGDTQGIVDTLLEVEERLVELKQSLEVDFFPTELKLLETVTKRVTHLRNIPTGRDEHDPVVVQQQRKWDNTRLDRMIVDYTIRAGDVALAEQIAKETGTEELVDIDAGDGLDASIALREGSSYGLAIMWLGTVIDSWSSSCDDAKLIKGATLMYRLCFVQCLEYLFTNQKNLAAEFAREILMPRMANVSPDSLIFTCDLTSNTPAFDLRNLLRLFTMSGDLSGERKCFPRADRDALTNLFDEVRLSEQGQPKESRLVACLRAGLTSLKTASSAKENEAKTKTELTSLTRDDPLSNPTFKRLAMTLPHTKRQTTRLVCRVTGQVMDEDNPPMLLPNGYVYSKKGVDFLLKKGQVLYCPRTGDGPFEKQEVKKAFVA